MPHQQLLFRSSPNPSSATYHYHHMQTPPPMQVYAQPQHTQMLPGNPETHINPCSPQNLVSSFVISDTDIDRICERMKFLLLRDIDTKIHEDTIPPKEEISVLKRENEDLRLKIEDLEQYSRSNFVRFNWYDGRQR